MLYFLDTEFIEDGNTIDLISIGIVSEDNREYYAINYDCDFKKANNWVKKNVIKHLPEQPLPQFHSNKESYHKSESYLQGWRNRILIAQEIKEFITGTPVFWGYYADYDWVVFCQLFGTMMDLPKGYPMYCRDLKQFCDDLGNPKLPKQDDAEHHALNDAKWNLKVYEYLCSIERRSLIGR